jgi:hypothetical protein
VNEDSGWLNWCRATERRQWWAAFLAYLILAICWSLATPLFASPDEPAHVVRAASVVRGQLLGRSAPQFEDEASAPLLVKVPEIFRSAAGVGCLAGQPQKTAECISFAGSTKTTEVKTTAGRHPPSYYATVGVPSLLFPSGFGVRLMRFVSALITAAFFASAFASARSVRAPRIAGLGLAVATTPMVLFLSGVVNPNAPEITAAMCLWATGLVMCDSERVVDRRLVIRLGVAASALALIRQLGPLWLLLIGLTIVGVAGLPRTLELLRRRAIRIVLLVAGLCATFQVLWVMSTGTLDPGNANTAGIDGPFSHIMRTAVGRETGFFLEFIGSFGWLDTRPPSFVWLMWSVALGGIVLMAILFARRQIVIAMLTTALLTWGVPFFLEARSAREAAFFWQGRYTLPFAVGIPILAGVGAAQRKEWPSFNYSRLAWCTGVALGTAQWLAFSQTIRRYAVGADGRLNFLTDTPWTPPVPAVALLLAFAVGLAVWYGLVLGGPIPGSGGEAPDGAELASRTVPEPALEAR